MPVQYERTEWYGLNYFFHYGLRGSLLPRCLPYMALSTTIGALVRSKVLEIGIIDAFGEDPHQYGMQLFGLVFGYLMIARVSISYNRYWEGSTHIKMMHSKWADACSQAIVFDRIDDHRIDMQHDEFCSHIVKLFSQLSAMATLRLHVQSSGVIAQGACCSENRPT